MEENEDMVEEYDRIKIRSRYESRYSSSSSSSLDANADTDEDEHFERLDDLILFDRKIENESKACEEFTW